MKLISLLIGTWVLAATFTQAQYAIDWFTLDAGGGQSAGGVYALQGTLGQPDAATSSGGPYAEQGGFWSAFAVVPSEGVPTLHIIPSGTNVILAWPNPSTGFHLQETYSLVAPDWTNVGIAPVVVGQEKQVAQPLAPGSRYFRLLSP